MVLELSIRRQTYIEDCEVCCQPIQISYGIESGSLGDFEAQRLE